MSRLLCRAVHRLGRLERLCAAVSTDTGPKIPTDFVDRKKAFINHKGRRFIDMRQVNLIGGHGGTGSVSFQQDPGARYPRRNGADGGVGGRVIIQVDTSLSSLNHVVPLYRGGRGGNAGSGKKIGAIGEDKILTVPQGTVARFDNGEVVDLDDPQSQYPAVLGGAGGWGNLGRGEDAPEEQEDPRVQGSPGEERIVNLEMRTIADVGLVGLPNAGKSSFLRAVSRAHPRVASYPFTTLNPYLGAVDFADTYRMIVADIPGLAIGAHDNVGLGHAFLRHILRSTVLLLIIDMSEELGSLEPCSALDALLKELKLYDASIIQKPVFVAANKMDQPKSAQNLQRLKLHTKLPVIPMSAEFGRGVTDVTAALRKLVEKSKPAQPSTTASEFALLMRTPRNKK